MTECIFCRIAEGEVPATIVDSDDRFVAFRDLSPKAPTHVLVIPRRHVASLADTTADDTDLLGHLLAATARIAHELRLDDGYRVAINSGEAAGQTVHHLHLHLLGGRAFGWPPG